MSVAERQRPQARIDAEASAWLARGRAGLSAADDRAFGAWIAADPRHGAAFEAMQRTFDDIASLKGLAELEPLDDLAAERRRRPLRAAPRRVRAAVAGLGAVAAAALAIVVAPDLLSAPDLTATTGVGEMRTLRLADGSRVTLGARSAIEVDFEAGERRVKLAGGEAFFEVAHDTARPFFVETGGTVVRVVGTKFDVRQAAGRVEVAVLEGVVQVRGRSLLPLAPQVRTLRAGERVRAGQAATLLTRAPMGEVQVAAATPGAWREGQLTYDGATLSELVADLNRYYAPGVRLEPGALGDSRLAASFKVHEIDAFLGELPAVVPVTVSRGPGGVVTISERAGAPPA